ncbi:MAG: hypothetical protein ACUVV1_08660, partial [Fimbriimonadales bacterium]
MEVDEIQLAEHAESHEQLHPFRELPSGLVEDVLQSTERLSKELENDLELLRRHRKEYRSKMLESGLCYKYGDLTPPSRSPTICGVDGSCAVERLLMSDLVVAAAVAVEGLTPPSETRYWEEPRHSVWVEVETHEAGINTLLR